MRLPSYEPGLAPQGRFVFEVNGLPEVRIGGNEKPYVIFKLLIIFSEGGSRKLNHIFWPSEARYGDLLTVLGAKKEGKKVLLDESDLLGKRFRADLAHVQDKKNPTVIREKVINIEAENEFSSLSNDENEEYDPFEKADGSK